MQLDSYVVDREFEELGQPIRRPDTLRRWMAAYGAAPATTSSLESIRAAALLGVDAEALLAGREGAVALPRDGTLLGYLFESLVVQSVRVYAQSAESQVRHLRTKGGRHEIDILIERRDGRVLAMEVKLTGAVKDADTRHLRWLRERMGDDLLDAVVITTGPTAYRRPDGIGVVPAGLLGP